MTLQTTISEERCTVQAVPSSHRLETVHDVVRSGLAHTPKTLPAFLLYDERGSKLFEDICLLPEYYLTNSEQAILDAHAGEMASYCAQQLQLIELGSGSSTKTRTFLNALYARGRRPVYRPIDISRSMLYRTARQLVKEYPQLQVHAIASDYQQGLEEVARRQGPQKVYLFLGSNLGNFSPTEAVSFLQQIRATMIHEDLLLLGVDLVKPLPVLMSAYDDEQGVTAEFSRNVLVRLNRELHANFVPERFRHLAVWNPENQAVEMYLESQGEQTVYIKDLDQLVAFTDGETIHTESSHKYTLDSLTRLCTAAKLRIRRTWTDQQGYFALNLISPAPESLA